MNDSKANEAAAEPPLDCRVGRELVKRLRDADENSQQRIMGSRIFGEAADEIERLREALKKANEQAEHFEREWYLRGDAIEALLACPSGHYCDAYPAAEKQARALLVPNA